MSGPVINVESDVDGGLQRVEAKQSMCFVDFHRDVIAMLSFWMENPIDAGALHARPPPVTGPFSVSIAASLSVTLGAQRRYGTDASGGRREV